ncbi:MAG TPA: 16S rRNA (guanine(527)-N(7))-methyltransferase RsmG [Micromonosporaceae bacterium]|nr:16S rRNA (guanine(527)-N(7))-methyltransferase RsmG [Micromonosporaceae bacterium]
MPALPPSAGSGASRPADDLSPGPVDPGPSVGGPELSVGGPELSGDGGPVSRGGGSISPAAAGGTVPDALLPSARRLFGDRLPTACRYADLLATEGVLRGLVGPREACRIWERHLLNCAVVGELVPYGASVVDVGSGAGLPGIVLAVARPDLAVTLVEPLARRTAFLTEAVAVLGLGAEVTVVRSRAEDLARPGRGAASVLPADVVTARAVAPLDKLAEWCLPLATVGGRLLAIKGASASDEVAAHRDRIVRLGGAEPTVRRCGLDVLDTPTTVVEIVRTRGVQAAVRRPGRRGRGASG